MSAANKFLLPRRPVPVGHGLVASCIGPPAAFSHSFFFFCPARPMLPQHMCGTRSLSRRKQEWSRLNQDTADGEKGFCPSSRCQTLVKLPGGFCQTHNPSTLDYRPTDRPCPGRRHRCCPRMSCGDSPTGSISSSNSMVGETWTSPLFPSSRSSFFSHRTGPVLRSDGIPSPPIEFSMEQFVTPPGCMRDPQRLRFD